MKREHKKHTYKRADRATVEKMEKLNNEMREDCMGFIFPRLHEGVTRDDENIRFAQKIFRNLLKQSAVVKG